MEKKSPNRRTFLKASAAAVTGMMIIPRHVLGGTGYVAPSDQLTKAIIGTGGMGRGHISYEGTKVVAICDVDKKHLQLAQSMIPNSVQLFHDYRELLLRPEIDIVHIATPPHWHGLIAMEAARAGKDIWCEKPMTRTIGEGQRVVEEVNKHGRMFRLKFLRDTGFILNSCKNKIHTPFILKNKADLMIECYFGIASLKIKTETSIFGFHPVTEFATSFQIIRGMCGTPVI